MLYHFTNDDGQTCCRTDDPAKLCSHCAVEARRPRVGRALQDLPSLIDRLRTSHGLPILEVREGVPQEEGEWVTF
jgi:hypothetical protein